MKKNHNTESLIAVLQLVCIGDIIYIGLKEINVIMQIIDMLNYQVPMKISEYVAYWNVVREYYDGYELCPKCGIPLTYAYQPYCGRCGQKLKWITKRNMMCQKML